MAYPQFALMTLQLIAVSTAMTLQEYKDAYGIDLTKTDIHAFKLVLFDGQKYAIDQIKDVEGGYEVYFNGRILTITDTIETSDEVYDVANAKPLYWHGLNIYNQNTKENIQAHIINNSPDLIDSVAKLKAWFISITGSVLLQSNGCYIIAGNVYTVTAVVKNDQNKFGILYIGNDGITETTYVDELSSYSVFNRIEDRTNRLN